MKIIEIEKKLYKVTKKTYEALRKAEWDHDGQSWPNENLQELCQTIVEGQHSGARYLGDVEFYYSELPF